MDERITYISKSVALDFFRQISALGSYPVFLMITIGFYLSGDSSKALFMFLGMILMYLIAAPMRIIFFKERPEPIPYTGIVEKIRAGSMPSLHSSRTVFLLLFLLPIFGDTFEHRMSLGFLALLILYSRIVRKRHFFIDIFIGIIVGLLSFYLLSYYFN